MLVDTGSEKNTGSSCAIIFTANAYEFTRLARSVISGKEGQIFKQQFHYSLPVITEAFKQMSTRWVEKDWNISLRVAMRLVLTSIIFPEINLNKRNDVSYFPNGSEDCLNHEKSSTEQTILR